MKQHSIRAHLLLAMVTVLVALMCLPAAAFGAQQVITDSQGRRYDSFDAALANVPNDGSVSLTLSNTSNKSSALSIKIDRPINVSVSTPQDQKTASKVGSIQMTAGTLTLNAGRFWTQNDKTSDFEKTSNLVVADVVSLTNAQMQASGVSFENLMRVYDTSQLTLTSCMASDPERRNAYRADKNATIMLLGKVVASVDACYIDGDMNIGSGCKLTKLNETDLINTSKQRGTALYVSRGATVDEIVNSTIYGSSKALFFTSAGSATLENCVVISDAGNPIDAGKDSSDWKGCRVEKSLEDSNRGVGRGAYYGSDREFDNTWFKGIVPEGYRLSRWTKQVEIADVSTIDCRYLVRTDCTLTYDANGGTGDMSSSNKKNQWGDRFQTVAKCTFTRQGASFMSWNTKEDGTGFEFKPGDRLSFETQKDIVLYAQWTTKMCTLVFDTQGGTPVASQTVVPGYTFKRPEDPTREGYTFGGWYKDAACTQEYDFATPASELSLTIYAKWLPDCTLVCNSMGGSQVDGVTVKYGQKVWEPATPKRPHYRFKGWYEDEQCTHLVDFPVTLTHKMTVYAKWDDYLDCHAWDEGVISKEATCNTYGTRTYTCTIDPSHTRTEPIPKKAHRWTSGFEPYHWTRDYRDRDTYYKDSTCDKAGRGMLAVYCQDCDFIIQRTWTSIPALGHDWGRWTPIEGTNEEQRVCSRNASHTETRTVRPESCRHGHLEHVLAKEPSCTEPGNNEYWACPDCHEWYLDETCTTAVSTVDEVQIPALSHELDDDSYDVITETEATCEAAGIETRVYRCTRCHQPISSVVQPIEPLGHDWGPWVPVEGTNEQERVCTRDASHTQRRETPTETCLHQDVLQIDAQNATCTRAGNKKYWVCTTCQEWFSDADCTQPIESTDQVILPALGHKPGEAARENEVAPSCEHPGSYDEVVRCTVCGDVLSSKSVVVPATGHTPGDAVNTNVVEATCEHAGTHDEVVTCTTCGKTLSHNTVQDSGPLGHEPGETERMNEVAPTCTDAGSYDEVTFCARCNKEFKRETVSIAPLDHDWGAWVLDDEGIAEVRICQRDARHMQTRTVTPESCTHENKVYVPGEKPTCTSEGSLAYWACPDCHEWYLDEDCTQPVTSSVIIERLAHTPGEEVHESEVPASCTEAGSYVSVVHCTVCSEELSRQIVTVPATGHTAGAVVKTNVVEATCEHAGTHDELVSCTSCNEVLSRKTVEDMPALGHKAGEATREEVRPATCEQEGFCDEVVCCTVCDEELSRQSVVIPATGHTAGAAVKAHVVEATCEHAGTHDEVVSCTVCDQELSRKTVEDAKPLGHVPSKAERENVVDPDCEFDGSHDEVVRCERCGDYLSWSWELDAATGHQWGAWQTIKEPTAYDEGLAKRVCAHNDAHIEYRSIPTLEHEHSLEHVEAKPASCVSEGNNEYWRCEDCDACFLDAEGTRPVESDADIVVARLAHTPDKAKQGDVAEATCEEDGYHDEDAYCKACGTLLSSKTVIDQALGHDWGNWETVEPASSTTAGLARRVCKRDSSHKQTMVVPALHNHTLVFVEQMDASCQAQGVRAHWRCTNENCGALFADSEGTKPVSADELAIPQCEHTPSDKKQKEQGRAATCSEEGISYEVSYCANCGEQIARNTITVSRVAHQQGELVHENVVDPTCSKRGTQDEVACCANCGTELWRRMVSIPCSDHTPGEAKIVNVVNPTETEPGSHDEVVSCTVCSQIISWETVVDPPTGVLYYVASGADSRWNRWDTAPLVFVIKRAQNDEKAFDLFDGILMDDEEVDDNGFAAEEADEGGVAIKLLPDYLNELGTGEHVLTANFADGRAQATFTLMTEDIPEPTGKTYVVAAFSCDENTHDSVADVSIEPSSHPYEEGSTVTVSAPVKDGWAFVGWYPVTKVSYGLVAEYDKSAQLSNQRSYTFTLTEDVSIVAVYRASGNVDATVRIETVNDATYTIACNGEKDPTVWQGSVHVVPIGTRLTVVAQDPGRVEQWLNESDKVIGTGQQELTYTVTSDTTITLMYSVEESTISQVKFMSLDDQVMLYHRYSANLDDASQVEIAAPPSRLGYLFRRWVFEGTKQEATQEAILEKIKNPTVRYAEIVLRPEYEDQTNTGSIIVFTQRNDDEPTKAFTKSVVLGKTGTVSAPELAGLDFEAWRTKDGEVLGYTKNLKLAVVGNHEVYAHYVPADTEVNRVPVTAITGFTKIVERDGVHKIQCLMERSVPEGYVMVENGVLYGMGLGHLSDDTFVYGTDDVLKHVFRSKGLDNATVLHRSVSSDSDRVYFRAYMVLKKAGSDDLLTYYSNVKWASFDSIA